MNDGRLPRRGGPKIVSSRRKRSKRGKPTATGGFAIMPACKELIGGYGPFALKYNTTITTSGSGTLPLRFNPTNPNRALSGTTSYDGFSNFGSLFDQYKVVGWKAKWTPNIGTSQSCPPWYWCYDPDDPDTGNATSAEEVANYRDYRQLNMREDWTYSIRPVAATSSSTAVQISKGGWYDFANPPIMGTVLTYLTGGPTSTYLGDLVLTMFIKVRVLRLPTGSELSVELHLARVSEIQRNNRDPDKLLLDIIRKPNVKRMSVELPAL